MKSTVDSRTIKIIFLSLTAVILVAGWFWWTRDLRSDPPVNFSGASQSLSTDPALYTYHARNRVLFGQADPLGDSRWILFEKSFASLIATWWFEATSVSIEHGRQVGVGLTFAGLIFLLLGLWRFHRPWVMAATAFCLLANCVLMVYGTYPFLEISLLFFSGLVFFIYARWGEHWWGLALAAVVVALATFAGKVLGLLLLPTLLLTDLSVTPRGNRVKRLGLALAVFGVGSVIVVTALYGSQLIDAFGFLREQSYQSKGFPDGLRTPWGLVNSLILYGFRNDLYYECPDLIWNFFAGMGLLLIGLNSRQGFFRTLPRTTVFALFWVLLTWISLSPLNYTPTRYSLTFIPAVIILCLSLLDFMHAQEMEWSPRFTRWSAVALGFLAWIVSVQIGLRWFATGRSPEIIPQYVLIGLSVGILVYALAQFLLPRYRLSLKRPVLAGLMIVTVVFSAASSVTGYQLFGLGLREYNIAAANTDLGHLLGPNAVVSGPYAAALTQENNVKSHLHFFGESWSDSSLLIKLPITHLAVDQSNFDQARLQSRSLQSARPVTTYWIGNHEVSVIDISRVYNNPGANAYVKSPYEKAIVYFDANMFDSAMAELAAVPDLIQKSRTAALLYARSILRAGLDVAAAHNYRVLYRLYPTDFLVTMETANALHQLGEIHSDSSMLAQAMDLYRRAVELNPYQAKRVHDLYQETADYFVAQRARQKSPPGK
jgi:tetratricopeptide (TPR) repeat protein